MSSLTSILNPQHDLRRDSSGSEQSPTASSHDNTPAPVIRLSPAPVFHRRPPVPANDYEHPPHPDCPDTLNCLPDTDGRPQHTLPVILRCAILGSPKRRLTIREIYAAMEEKYPYYRTAGPTWKQSVRHHLSLNRLFERQARPVTDPGFGSYWTVNLQAPPGTKRPRKRGRSKKEEEELEGLGLPPSPVIKRRGRPRKNTVDSNFSSYSAASDTAAVSTRLSAVRTGGSDWDDEDEEQDQLVEYEDASGHVQGLAPFSEPEYESEEDMQVHFDHSSGIQGFPDGHKSMHPRTIVINRGHHKKRSVAAVAPPPPPPPQPIRESFISHTQTELDSLRRQAQDALQLSLRISNQLDNAQAEATRARNALRATEGMLEEEARKRRDAERIAEDEKRQRMAAEHDLQELRKRCKCQSA